MKYYEVLAPINIHVRKRFSKLKYISCFSIIPLCVSTRCMLLYISVMDCIRKMLYSLFLFTDEASTLTKHTWVCMMYMIDTLCQIEGQCIIGMCGVCSQVIIGAGLCSLYVQHRWCERPLPPTPLFTLPRQTLQTQIQIFIGDGHKNKCIYRLILLGHL